MVQQIKVLVPPVELPGGSGQITTVNAVVNLTDDDVAMISPTAFTSQPVDAHNPSGSAILQNLGFVGQGTGPVSVQGAAVSAVGALTSAQDGALTSTTLALPGSSYSTEAATINTDFNALRTDVSNLRTQYNAAQVDIATLRTTLNTLIANLSVTGGALA